MIKRMNKMKKDKQGSILIVVVLILALAIIFISSAMMLTQATRGRLYENTLSSQARLTVTAASEVFLEALETQEINDVTLDKLLAVNGVGPKSSDNQKLRMVVEGVPGMSADDDTNCTFVDVYYKDSNKKVAVIDFKTTIGSETENVRVYLDIKASGASYGNRFKNQIEIGSGAGDHELRFTHGVGMVNPSKTDVTDNTILLRGNAEEHASSAVFYSDVVFAKDGEAKFGGNNEFYGNTIFLDSEMHSGSGGVKLYGDLYFVGNTKTSAGFVLDGTNQYESARFPNHSDGTQRNWVFMNMKAQDSTQDTIHDANSKKIKELLDDKACYFVKKEVDGDGSVYFTANAVVNSYYDSTSGQPVQNYPYTNLADSGVSLTVSDNLSRYSASDFCNVNKAFPSGTSQEVADAAFNTWSVDGYETATSDITLTYDTYRKNGTKIDAGDTIHAGEEYEANPLTPEFPAWLRTGGVPTGAIPDTYKFALTETNLNDKKDANGVIDLEAGYYYFTPGTVGPEKTVGENKLPYIIAIDGSKADQYRFYFQKDGYFKLGMVVFAIYNVNKANPTPVVFILEPGATIEFSESQYHNYNAICSAGIISIQHVDEDGAALYSDAGEIGNWIRTKSYTTELSNWGDTYHQCHTDSGAEGAVIEYPYAYDSNRRPAAYVFATNTGIVKVGDCTRLEAYMGLYGTGSEFAARTDIDNSHPLFIYGRIEATKFTESGTTGGFCMPYCPQPYASSDKHGQQAAESKFSVNNIIYYR